MLIVKLRGMGWTTEKIAEAVGVGSGTIWRDIDSPAFPNGKAEIPPTVLGKDGKRYPTKYKKRKKKILFPIPQPTILCNRNVYTLYVVVSLVPILWQFCRVKLTFCLYGAVLCVWCTIIGIM